MHNTQPVTPSPEDFAAPYATIYSLAKKELFRRGFFPTIEVRDITHEIILYTAYRFDPTLHGATEVFDLKLYPAFAGFAHQEVNVERAIETALYRDDRAKASICVDCRNRSRDCICGSRRRTGRLLPKSLLCPADAGMRPPEGDPLSQLLAKELDEDIRDHLTRLLSFQRALAPTDQRLWRSIIHGIRDITQLSKITNTSLKRTRRRVNALIARAARVLEIPVRYLRIVIRAINN